MPDRKVVINTCYGGFSVQQWVRDALGYEWDHYIPRDDPRLVALLEEKGNKALRGACADLKIAAIPSDVDWTIEEYDGMEWVAEKHRTWS